MLGFIAVKIAEFWFSSHVNNAGYLESERSVDVEEIKRLATEIGDIGVGLWTKNWSEDDLVDERRSVARLRDLTSAVSLLFEDHEEFKKAALLEVDRLDEAVTSGDFGTRRRKADPARVAAIMEGASSVSFCAKKCRRRMAPLWFVRRK